MKIIDATDLIVGRIATRIAKQLLLGETIVVINAEKAVFTGTKEMLLTKFKQKRNFGIPLNGPYYPRRADMILKRIVRGMLPYKQEKGSNAFKRLTCYISVPEKYADRQAETIEEAHIKNSSKEKYVDLYTISKSLGAKI